MNTLKVAVIGAGRLGQIHAKLLQQVPHCELVAVADPDVGAREKVAQNLGCRTVSDYQEISDDIDAAVIATPTQFHFQVARELLLDGVHLLIEKPITTTVAEADQLIALAADNGCVLQVGHVERFNPAWQEFQHHEFRARHIQTRRTSTYTCRSTDVGVVLDLMIHDLDLVLSLVGSTPTSVHASGGVVIGPHEDVADAWLEFANGVRAHLHTSRVSNHPNRELRAYGPDGEVVVDFSGSGNQYKSISAAVRDGIDVVALPVDGKERLTSTLFDDYLPVKDVSPEPCNAILEEQKDFVMAILTGARPHVRGEHGRDALAVAQQIVETIRESGWTCSHTEGDQRRRAG